MIVTCDNCGTKYNLPEAKIPAGGAKVKCSKCSHVFKVVPPAPEPEPEPEEDDLLAGLGEDFDDSGEDAGAADEPGASDDEAPDEDVVDDDDDLAGLPDDDLDDDLGGDVDGGGDDDLDDLGDDFGDLPDDDEEAEESEEDDLDDLFGDDDDDLDEDLPFGDDEEEEEGDEDLEEDEDEIDDEEEEEEEEEYEDEEYDEDAGGGFGLDDAGAGKKAGGGKSGLIKLLILLLVLLLAGGAVWYFKAWQYIPFLGGDEAATPAEAPATGNQAGKDQGTTPPEAPPAASPAEQVKNIGLIKVRQFYVSNEKNANKLFVIEGSAVNNFPIPKELIKVEATLYDSTGKVVAQKAQMAGNTLSLFQLQVMTREQIDESLGSEVGILSNNTFLRPGVDVPFMLVFFDVPESVKEFGVKVVEAKDPPKE